MEYGNTYVGISVDDYNALLDVLNDDGDALLATYFDLSTTYTGAGNVKYYLFTDRSDKPWDEFLEDYDLFELYVTTFTLIKSSQLPDTP